jgi:hypothetical protein
MNYDVFNGDADGIIALLQLRLSTPQQSVLVTGVKRDINLLAQVNVQSGDKLTVLDISLEQNIDGVNLALANGAQVFYTDHHRSGRIPNHNNLQANIDLDANTCTALIIDKLIGGQFHLWAITAAYGDNLIAKAEQLSATAGLTFEQAAQLKELGTLINYNGYGAKVEDLHFHPAELYKLLLQYSSPLDVISDKNSPFALLQQAYQTDLDAVLNIKPTYKSTQLTLYILPDTPWARRISGVYGNLLANQTPSSAHAVLTESGDGNYLLSLRAPLDNKHGAAEICSQFATGGGRAAAAGINRLPIAQLPEFIATVEAFY